MSKITRRTFFKYLSLPLLLLLLTSCAHYDRTDKFLMACTVVSHTTDYLTTVNALKNPSIYEQNFMLKDRPSRSEVGLFKAGVIGVFWGASELMPKYRRQILGVGCISGTGATLWNLQF